MKPVPGMDIREALAHVEPQLKQVESVIADQLKDAHPSIRPVLDAFRFSGKMIRPALVLLSGLCCGKISDAHIRTAAVLEMIHSATLLHDDVIDQGQQRRRSQTVNALHGNEAAVLLGDWLLSHVFRMCPDLDGRVVPRIAQMTCRVCEGELRQIIQRGNWQLDQQQYFEIIHQKSAALFATCCWSGAILAGAEEKIAEIFEQYGLSLGIAFQITDDVLDINGDPAQTGKLACRDILQGELTLPLIHYLSYLDTAERQPFIDQLKQGRLSSRQLKHQLQQTSSLSFAITKAGDFANEAIERLSGLNGQFQPRAIEALKIAARFSVERLH